MNYNPQVNNHGLPFYALPLPRTQNSDSVTNKFIYVKQDFLNNPVPIYTPKVLINPHFKKTVYLNPKFNPLQNASTSKPKIHVNPNVLKNFAVASTTTVPTNKTPTHEPKSKSVTVISTRTKLVRVPCNSVTSDHKNVRKARNSIHTKYKLVRNLSSTSKNKFELDKRPINIPNHLRSAKKKYVYVNRFMSISEMAKSTLLRQKSKLSGFVNISGILYKKSPNSLKRALETSPKLLSSKYKFVRKPTKNLPNTSIYNNRKTLLNSSKLKKIKRKSISKLRKCNIPCLVYRRFGKCRGQQDGTCFKVHNPNQIALCTKFLQGACFNKNCLLSHKVSLEKMPTCKYFLEGMCNKEDCSYLHVRISPTAEICRDFLEGYCKRGAQCDKRHQFLCPDFAKNKFCPKKRCPYPHGNLVRKRRVSNLVAKKCSVKKAKTKKKVLGTPDKTKRSEVSLPETNNRYYRDLVPGNSGQDEENVITTIAQERPKLGDLPAYIPLSKST